MTDNRMNYCPCCHEKLLRHICRNRVYWFCPNCRQEMPLLREDTKNRKSEQKKYEIQKYRAVN